MKKKLLLMLATLMSITGALACWTEITTSSQCLFIGSSVTVTGHRYASTDWDNDVHHKIQISYNGTNWITVSNNDTYTFNSFYGQTVYFRYQAKEQNQAMPAYPYGWVTSANYVTVSKCGVLGAPITRFDARVDNRTVTLDWETGIDNMHHFQSERSFNGIDFTPFATIDAVSGRLGYQTRDILYPGVQVFYRLSAQDLGGTIYTSQIISVTIPPSSEFRVYPNPTNGRATVEAPSSDTRFMFRLCTMEGNVVQPESTIRTGTGTIDITSNRIAKGMYILHFIDPSGKLQWKPQKITKQ